MKIIKFPTKKKKLKKCHCTYIYRIIFDPDAATFGAQIANNKDEKKVEFMTFIAGFEQETEADAAAFGFIEALHYVHSGGKYE